MRVGTSLVLHLGLAVTTCGCSSKTSKQSLGSAAELRVRAASLGCDVKRSGKVVQDRLFPGRDVRTEGCHASVGPCNCLIEVYYYATADTDELLKVKIAAFNCQRGSSLEKIFRLSDPLILDEADRAAFHALLAAPPKVEGADANSRITATRPLRSVVIDGWWEPVVWKDFSPSPADQAFGEENVLVSITLKSEGEHDTTTESSPTNFSREPSPNPCRDGTLRPWEARPQ